MLETHVIQVKGFKNVGGDPPTGFQVAVRCPYYRGVWASLLEGAELTVDGESFAADRVRWTLGGETFTAPELAASEGLRWPFEEPAILTVDRLGGLEPGLHEIEVAITWRWSYIPVEMQPTTNVATRKVVLVDERDGAGAGGAGAEQPIELGVSLYSYGGDFQVTMTLEDCLADIADMGATGVEILADTHVAGYPSPSLKWVDEWHRLVERYDLTPTCYSSWLDTRLHDGRALTVDEATAILERDLELAHRLGFSIVRPKLGVVSLDLIPDPIWRETVLRALPTAERHGIRIAPEIHAPTPLRSTIVDDYLDLVRETGTEHFGLLIDTGIFQTNVRTGGHSDAVYIFGDPDPELRERVGREMSKPLAVDPADLADLMPYVFHVHAKFWDMTDGLDDPHIPYGPVVEALAAGGYRGSLSSEYEGPRDLYRASDMVRRQQVMLRRLVAAGSGVAR